MLLLKQVEETPHYAIQWTEFNNSTTSSAKATDSRAIASAKRRIQHRLLVLLQPNSSHAGFLMQSSLALALPFPVPLLAPVCL